MKEPEKPPSANPKAKAKSKGKPEEEEPPAPAEPVYDPAVEALAKAYLELRDMAVSTCERHNTLSAEAEEERQRDLERRRRQRKAAAQAAKEATRTRLGPILGSP
eukprot:s410_g17.t1